MRIDVVGKHMDITEAIRSFATQKASKVTKHFDDGVQMITVRLEQMAHNKGFHAEIVVDVVHHDDFVAHAKGDDLYTCIDEAAEKAARQLTAFKEKLKQNKRGGPSATG